MAPLEYAGGGEFSAITLGNYLTSKSLEVSVLYDSQNRDLTRKSYSAIAEQIKFKYGSVTYLKHMGIPFVKPLFHPLPKISDLTSDGINLIFLHRIPWPNYLRSLKKSSVKVVFLFHGLSFEERWAPNIAVIFYEIWKRMILYYSGKFLNSKKIYFQVFTAAVKNRLESVSISKENIRVIPGSVVNFQRCQVSKNDDLFLVIFLGRIENLQKGIDRLIKVIKRVAKLHLKDLGFVILGEGTNKAKLMKSIAMESSVSYLGFVEEEDKIYWLSRANLMIITSNVEPWGLTVLEGLASGLEVLSTPVSGPSEILSKNKILGKILGYSVSGFVKEIIREHQSWLNDKERFYFEKVRRKELARQLYDDKAVMVEYYSMIKDVISKD